ncbi:MAG TPA: TonB-dependent receptor [Cyclobacteriaceae bacterium]|nr:TonB-dependent receptor [Cyclobacteriaceae bacterium]
MNRSLLIILAIAFSWGVTKAQNVKEIFVDESYNGRVFSEFLKEIEDKYKIDFLFDEEKMEALTVAGITERERLMEYLERYLVLFQVTRVKDNVVFISNKSDGDEYGMRKDDFFLLALPQERNATIKGQIIDGGNNEPVIGAQVIVQELDQGTLTDTNGNFSFKVNPGIYHIEIKYVGYQSHYYVVGFSTYGTGNEIKGTVFAESRELESVVVTAERMDVNVTRELTGVEMMTIETIKSLPTFMGEVDPVRSLTTLPGVSTVGELSSGFNVRGGEAGQNLILQDGAPIYNPSHLFGFFSAFNPDMVSDVVLYKGGGPANFGGRISSVLDIDLKNGDAGKHTLTGGVGLISSRLSVEGPIVKGKSSYLVGGRISYPNWLIHSTKNIQLQNSAAKFYDFTAKLFHTFNSNNVVSLSAYSSYDDFKLASDSTFSWGSLNFSLRWDHTFNERLSATLGVFNSNYFSKINSEDEIDAFIYQNEINTTGLKYDLAFSQSERLKLLGGLEINRVQIEPGRIKPSDPEGNVQYQNINDQNEIETALFVQGDYDLSDRLSISAGLRYSHFFRVGPDEIYVFDYSNIEGRYPAISDTISYGDGEIIKQFHGFEPRISFRYLLTGTTSIKASYYRGFQYLHLISNTTSATPQDYWVTSGPYLKPEIGDQFSLGLFKNFKDNKYELSLEGFYKKIKNTVDYIEGADITLNPKLEAGLAQGDGLAYGLEFLLRKNTGRLNGWLSYTYSRSLRKFKSDLEVKTINEGDYYPSFFDKPHNLSLILNYRLAERTVLSANFNYSTGRPITIPISKFSYDAYLAVLNYSERNEYRIPDYHRLDLSITFKDKPKRNKRWMGEWIISVFNVYGRDNAYSIYFNRYGKASKLSVLGTVFPSFSYNFKF